MTDLLGRRRGRKRPDDGAQMPLVEHLRELRSRLLKSLAAIALGAVVGLIYYERITEFLLAPFQEQIVVGGDVQVVISGILTAFTFQLKVAALTGFVLASPVWLYQIWAFVLPGLYRTERRYTYLFFATALPLFLAGMAAAYYLLPKSFDILLGFTPERVSNLVPIDEYLSFMIRFLVVFGIAFELPVIVVLLNVVGVVSAAQLRSWWRPIVFLIFVFAAVATPTPDPFSMMVLATPMVLLFGVSLLVTTLVDRRRRRRNPEPDYDALDDDETSALDLTPSAIDDDEHDEPPPLDREPDRGRADQPDPPSRLLSRYTDDTT